MSASVDTFRAAFRSIARKKTFTMCTNNCDNATLSVMNYLFDGSRYSPMINPNVGSQAPLTVFVAFTLVQLLAIENQGVMSIAGAITLSWQDQNLGWDPDDYDGLAVMAIPLSNVWYPRFVLQNGEYGNFAIELNNGSAAMLNYRGIITLSNARQFQASCSLDLVAFPFDTQNCTLSFVSLDMQNPNYPAVNFMLIVSDGTVDSQIFPPDGEFSLVASKTTTGYKLLPKYSWSQAYVNVTLVFKRNNEYYIASIAIPSVCLIFVMALLFLLPGEDTAKISTACSLIISLYLLQQAVVVLLPATNYNPQISIGLMIQFVLGFFTLACAVVSVSLSKTKPKLSSCSLKLVQLYDRIFHPKLRAKKSDAVELSDDSTKTLLLEVRRETASFESPFDQLAAAVDQLLLASVLQAEQLSRAAEQTRKDEEHARNWSITDSFTNYLALMAFIATFLATCLFSLFDVV